MNATITICQKYNVTREQLDQTDRILDMRRHKPFFNVEGDPVEDPYHVEWNDELHRIICTCTDANCWHIRAAQAVQELHVQQLQREQEDVEATEEYQTESLLAELDTIFAKLDAIAAQADERDARHQAALRLI